MSSLFFSFVKYIENVRLLVWMIRFTKTISVDKINMNDSLNFCIHLKHFYDVQTVQLAI